jgi:competence protein CoiA
MQLYALDQASPVIATQADKKKTYQCPECSSPLKMREGPLRQPHFYHLKTSSTCRQHQKSEEHIRVQLHLLQLIGPQEAQMEAPFPSINRIADIAWHEKKMIFEIQCSPISLQEAKERCLDYEKMGYNLFWILHDKRFNKKKLTAAEHFLRSRGGYFTNINKIGIGIFYDQLDLVKNHRRLAKGPKLPITPLAFFPIPSISTSTLPETLSQRILQWKWYCKGDLLERLLKEGTPSYSLTPLPQKEKDKRLPLHTLLFKAYTGLLQWFLKN